MFRYCEIVKGGVKNRGNIVELPEGKVNMTLDYFSKEAIDSHNSIYMHTKDLLNYKEINGSIRGYNGKVFSEYLFWDMDSENLDNARKDTIELVDRLIPYTNKPRIFFSGRKGFHVCFYCPELNEYKDIDDFTSKYRAVCLNIASGLPCLDNSIYDKTRIVRTPNSIHPDTKKYKIEISYDELLSLTNDEIRQLASEQRKLSNIELIDVYCDELVEVLNNSEIQTVTVSGGKYNGDELFDGIVHGFQRGHRNNGYTSLAGMLHNRNVDSEYVEAFLQNSNKASADPLPEEEISSIVASICRYPSSCIERRQPAIVPVKNDFITFKEAGKLWVDSMNRSGNFSLGDRFKDINEIMSVTLLGDLIGIVANSGVGKSTMAMDFANCYSQEKDTYSAFFSLEMAAHACFFRGATISYTPDANGDVSSKEVAYNLLHEKELMEKVCDEWNRILILDKGSISLGAIEKYSEAAREVTKDKLGSIIIDYCQYIEGASDISRSMEIARDIKEVLKRINAIGFLPMQCNKTMPDGFTEVEDSHIEGVKAWKQACDYIIAMWKSRDDDKRLHGKFLKTRWEKDNGRFDLIRSGLKYHTEPYKPDRTNGSRGL